MANDDFPFEIGKIEWKHVESDELRADPNPGEPIRSGVQRMAVRCLKCGATWKASKGPSGAGGGFFDARIGAIGLECPNSECDAEGTISNRELEEIATK